MSLNSIKNLVFDIGGVLIGYRWKEMLMDYGLNETDATRVGMSIFNDSIWRDYDRGIISDNDLVDHYVRSYPEDAAHMEYFLRNCELIKINRPKVWERVEKLKEMGYGIYILSNYSESLVKLHVKDMKLFEDIDGRIISYEVKSIKPEPEIYKALFDKYNLNPKECLFFDDREDNVEASRAEGMKARIVESEEHIISMLDELIEKGVQ